MAKYHVLIIDDNRLNQRKLQDLLESLDCTSHVASNGYEGVFLLENNEYHFLLLDIKMPEMDGMKAYTIIREGKVKIKNSQIPIITLTNEASEELLQRAESIGMSNFLVKPYLPEKLINYINSFGI